MAGVVAVAVAIDADKGFLGEIGSGRVVADHAEEETEESVFPGTHESVHGGVVTCGEVGHEEFVGFIAGRLHGVRAIFSDGRGFCRLRRVTERFARQK